MTEKPAVPLLLLAGLTNDDRVWRGVTDALGKGVQASVGDLSKHESMKALAAAVLSNAPARFAVAGLSMGGYCALEILRQAPERVLGVALVDTSARPDTPESRKSREAQIERARDGYAALIDEAIPKWVHPAHLADARIGGVARAMALAAGPDVFTRQQRAIMSRADSRPLLSAIDCPTAVVCGRDDALIPMEVHEELAMGLRGATFTVIDTCGHLAPLERPAEVAAALAAWIRRIG